MKWLRTSTLGRSRLRPEADLRRLRLIRRLRLVTLRYVAWCFTFTMKHRCASDPSWIQLGQSLVGGLPRLFSTRCGQTSARQSRSGLCRQSCLL